jgi:hypothetical protein
MERQESEAKANRSRSSSVAAKPTYGGIQKTIIKVDMAVPGNRKDKTWIIPFGAHRGASVHFWETSNLHGQPMNVIHGLRLTLGHQCAQTSDAIDVTYI